MTDRILQASVLLMAVFITASLYFAPQTTLMSLVSTDTSMYAIRIIIALSALGMLLTRPPRTTNMRLLFGGISVLLFSWVSYATFNNDFPLLDSILLSVASVVFGLAALEYNPIEKASNSRTLSA